MFVKFFVIEGRSFYSCSKPIGQDCGFFLWAVQSDEMSSKKGKAGEKVSAGDKSTSIKDGAPDKSTSIKDGAADKSTSIKCSCGDPVKK